MFIVVLLAFGTLLGRRITAQPGSGVSLAGVSRNMLSSWRSNDSTLQKASRYLSCGPLARQASVSDSPRAMRALSAARSCSFLIEGLSKFIATMRFAAASVCTPAHASGSLRGRSGLSVGPLTGADAGDRKRCLSASPSGTSLTRARRRARCAGSGFPQLVPSEPDRYRCSPGARG